MLVMVSTTWPVTTARAAARAFERARIARHVVADQHGVAGEPHRHRQRQPEVDAADDRHRSDDRGDRETEGVDRFGDGVGNRPRRLLLLLGDAPGEVVVEERQRLPERVPVQPRQHQRIEVRPEGQAVQRRPRPQEARAQDQEEAGRGEEPGPALGDQPVGAARLGEVDQPADDGRRPDLGRADGDREKEADPDRRERALQRPAHEGEEPRRRRPLGAGEGVDEVGEEPHSAASRLRKPPDCRSQSRE